MNIYRHKTHTAFAIRNWNYDQSGLVIIHNTGNRIPILTLFNPRNWRFNIQRNNFSSFCQIRLPFFLFNKDNCGIKIGHPNLYLWIIF